MDIHYATLSEVVGRVSSGEPKATQLVEAMLERIDRLDPRLRAYATVTPERAMRQAEALDASREAGHALGSLHGAPIGLKDLLLTRDIPTTGGMALYQDWLPDEDATIVERLEAAGAITLGKLKTTEGASAEHHPDVAPPVNPWDAERWTGVSSSGPAVAVSAGLAHGAIGSDTGGSIRYPSACCGLVGIKPTYGRVSRHGTFALAESMDHFGPMTRSVEDAARMLGAIAGYDPRDPTSLQAEVPDYLGHGLDALDGVRIGVDRGHIETGVHPMVVAAIDDVIVLARDSGASIVEVEMPDATELVHGWPVTCTVECADFHRETFPSRRDEDGPALAKAIEKGRAETGAIAYAALERQRRVFRGELERLLTTVDVVLSPAMPVPTPTTEWVDAHPDGHAGVDMRTFAAPYDYSGHPTITLPLDLDPDGLPRSFQLIGPLLGERRLIDIARVLEREAAFDAHPL